MTERERAITSHAMKFRCPRCRRARDRFCVTTSGGVRMRPCLQRLELGELAWLRLQVAELEEALLTQLRKTDREVSGLRGEIRDLRDQLFSEREERNKADQERERVRAEDQRRRDELSRFPGHGAG